MPAVEQCQASKSVERQDVFVVFKSLLWLYIRPKKVGLRLNLDVVKVEVEAVFVRFLEKQNTAVQSVPSGS